MGTPESLPSGTSTPWERRGRREEVMGGEHSGLQEDEEDREAHGGLWGNIKEKGLRGDSTSRPGPLIPTPHKNPRGGRVFVTQGTGSQHGWTLQK